MKCNEFQRLIEERLCGTLSRVREREFDIHRKKCASCEAEYSLMRRLRNAGEKTGSEPPEGFQEALKRRIEEYKTLGFGKLEVKLPGVRFDASDDISFLRYTRYYALKNYYRRKIFRALGEYFPNRAAASLLADVALYREGQERLLGRRISFRRALESWKEERFPGWREEWKKAPEDEDHRLIVRLRRRIMSGGRGRAAAALLSGALCAFFLVLLLSGLLAAGRRKLVIAHHFQGTRKKLFCARMRLLGERAGINVVFREFPPEAVVFLFHHRGGAFIRRAAPHLLIMDINILEILRTRMRFHDQNTRRGDVRGPSHYSVRPLALAQEPGSNRRMGDPADFWNFAAALTAGDSRFPNRNIARLRFGGFLRAVRQGKRIRRTLPVLYGVACIQELKGARRKFFDELIRGGQGLVRLPGFRAWRKGQTVLFDPDGYYRWRLAFPEYRIYSLLKIDRNPLLSFCILLDGAPGLMRNKR